MVLLHALNELQEEFNWRLFAAYFNHRLRGKDDERDGRLIQQFCHQNQIPLFQGHWKTSRANPSGISLEMAARTVRHGFLGGVAKRKRAMVVMGHHADDQVELYFMRLLRGAGGEGLGGMRSKSLIQGYRSIRLLRPLLDFRKQVLLDYAKNNRVEFNEDSSNRDIDLERNWVRHRLLPYLKKSCGKGLHAICLRTMKIVGAEHSFAEQEAMAWLAKRKRVAFTDLHTAVQRQVVRIQMIALGVFPEFDRIEELRGSVVRRVSVSRGKHLILDASGHLSACEVESSPSKNSPVDLELTGTTTRHEGFGGNLILRQTKNRSARKDGLECFDADKVGATIRLRNWLSGDRFQPIGMKYEVKLQDLFVNQKIPRQLRHQLMIAENERGVIFWVEGFRIGEVAKMDSGSRRFLTWKWTRS